MDILKISGVEIAGVCGCLPENLIDNREACKPLYGDGVETLIKATGINARAVVNKGTTTLDLCVKAAQKLLDETKTAPEEIGAVICVTFTPEHLMPADSPSAQFRLGLPNNCMAFDLNMACSGYGYGLYLGASIASQLNKKVLVLDGDVQSAYTSPEDKATMPVLADAGTATLLKPNPAAPEWHFSFYTDGTGSKVLYIPAGGAKEATRPEDLEAIEREDGSKRRNADIYMDGFAIFKFVSITACHFIQDYMSAREITPESLDAFVPHQANIYMITQLTKKLKIEKEKMWKCGDIYGNPSSASVPLTIAANGNNLPCGHTLFSGFGGGLSVSVGDIYINKDAYYGITKITE